MLTYQGIYEFVNEKYPQNYRMEDTSWQSTIRSCLSKLSKRKKTFVKVPQEPGKRKMCFWKLNPASEGKRACLRSPSLDGRGTAPRAASLRPLRAAHSDRADSPVLSSADVAAEREELELTIKELREKLFKQQHTYATLVKKLRAKEKESETTLKSQRDKLEEQSRELERLRRQLAAKEEL